MSAEGKKRGITFHWEVLRRFPTVLPGFILVSLLGHASMFFVFQVVYPPQTTMSAPPPAVTVLDPRRPDHQALLRWIESEDPAPTHDSNGITDRLLQVAYKPSYATQRTPPLTLPEEKAQIQYPPARDPLAIIRSPENRAASSPASPAGEATSFVLSANLKSRGPAEFPRFTGTNATSDLLESATFLIGVNERGVVQYVVPQSSSGNMAMDDLAARYLADLVLKPAGAPVTWGSVVVHWGPEAYKKSTP